MQQQQDYGIVPEKLESRPELLEGESVSFSASPAFTFFHGLAAVLLTFVPPFVWGLAMFW
jgi:hypothetical protein